MQVKIIYLIMWLYCWGFSSVSIGRDCLENINIDFGLIDEAQRIILNTKGIMKDKLQLNYI